MKRKFAKQTCHRTIPNNNIDTILNEIMIKSTNE